MEQNVKFTSPTFTKRLKGMLSVDFYRLFNTPLFYIFLCIAAIIPALVSMGFSIKDPETNQIIGTSLKNIWVMVASKTPLYVVNDISEYANMNMVFIFGGIMVSIFIGHDYKSGYVKQLFTTHAKKQDYMLSKTITSAFAMASMCITYLIGTIGAGIVLQVSFKINIGSLLLCILSKMIMSLGWASLYTFINIIFKRFFGNSIIASFFFGTGILIIGAAAIFGNSSILNIFLYGASVYACQTSTIITLLVCLINSIIWFVIYNVLGTIILNHTDVY